MNKTSQDGEERAENDETNSQGHASRIQKTGRVNAAEARDYYETIVVDFRISAVGNPQPPVRPGTISELDGI
ncbi:hypothetical protein [Acrocarpospora phusangensis]|uniref:hypothetical protein n=1 Tax=Acrocarpospora phusangensis TaxID=1070424 RepID=UPI00194E9A95|nr:hypothetical protein [Acrocarpospora phusangensis]